MQTLFNNLTTGLATLGIAPPYIANFDSGSAMLRATANFLRGEDFPGMGVAPPAIGSIADSIKKLPRQVQEILYTLGSASEAIPVNLLGGVNAEAVAEWMVKQYPHRQYSAVAIGSSCGALVHLYAALGVPWLPQTFLIPVLHPEIHLDDPKEAMEWGRKYLRLCSTLTLTSNCTICTAPTRIV